MESAGTDHHKPSETERDEYARELNAKNKRKLSDMLGPQWGKEKLEYFYEAYRKHGKDWKKVGAVLRNRSFEMVEALYTMNKFTLRRIIVVSEVAFLLWGVVCSSAGIELRGVGSFEAAICYCLSCLVFLDLLLQEDRLLVGVG
ncbi:hypothetical protein AgCh_001903 [Apium graveolens]